MYDFKTSLSKGFLGPFTGGLACKAESSWFACDTMKFRYVAFILFVTTILSTAQGSEYNTSKRINELLLEQTKVQAQFDLVRGMIESLPPPSGSPLNQALQLFLEIFTSSYQNNLNDQEEILWLLYAQQKEIESLHSQVGALKLSDKKSE